MPRTEDMGCTPIPMLSSERDGFSFEDFRSLKLMAITDGEREGIRQEPGLKEHHDSM